MAHKLHTETHQHIFLPGRMLAEAMLACAMACFSCIPSSHAAPCVVCTRWVGTKCGTACCNAQEKKKEMAQNATLAVTGAVGWRREGIRYKKNEVYLDVIETVNLLMSSNGACCMAATSGWMA